MVANKTPICHNSYHIICTWWRGRYLELRKGDDGQEKHSKVTRVYLEVMGKNEDSYIFHDATNANFTGFIRNHYRNLLKI